MSTQSMLRRGALHFCTGTVAVLLATRARGAALPGSGSATESAVRLYYRLWERKDWAPFDALLASYFTFTSANDDDHISKTAFKKQC